MNQSFIDVQNQLEEMGVSNTGFLTKTMDERVIDLGPYGSKLTEPQKQLITEECRSNFWYFLREVARVKTQGGGYNRFKLDIASCAFLYLYENNISAWFQHSRQTGTSITIRVCKRYTNVFYPEKAIIHEYYKDGYGKDTLIVVPDYFKDFNKPYKEKGRIAIYDDAESYLSYDTFISMLDSDIENMQYYYNSAIVKGAKTKLVKCINEIPVFDVSMFDMDVELLKLKYPIIKIDFPIEQVILNKDELKSYLRTFRSILPIDMYMREILKIRI